LIGACVNSSSIPNNPLASLCSETVTSMVTEWQKVSVSSPELLAQQDFEDYLTWEFETVCFLALEEMDSFRHKLLPFLRAVNVNTDNLEDGTPAASFADEVYQVFVDNNYCDLNTWAVLDWSDEYQNYFDTCDVPQCQWMEDQGHLETVMKSIAIIGSVWGILILISSTLYALLAVRDAEGAKNLLGGCCGDEE